MPSVFLKKKKTTTTKTTKEAWGPTAIFHKLWESSVPLALYWVALQ